MKKKWCMCCKKEIKSHSNIKYCTNCSLYTFELRRQISYYKLKSKKLNKYIYGTESGSERIRGSLNE